MLSGVHPESVSYVTDALSGRKYCSDNSTTIGGGDAWDGFHYQNFMLCECKLSDRFPCEVSVGTGGVRCGVEHSEIVAGGTCEGNWDVLCSLNERLVADGINEITVLWDPRELGV